jgi:basic membrane protein A
MAGLSRLNARIDRRKLIAASGGAVLGANALGANSPIAAQDAIIATLVTDTAGIGDQNFNDLANAGGQRAAEELGVDWRVLESQTAADYVTNLTLGAEQGEVTVPNGFLLADAVAEVAPQFPDRFFVFIDAVAEFDNVQNYLFKENEGAFLGGILAGLATTTNNLGMVGGQRIPPVIRYEVGFAAGVMTVNPDATFTPSYADDFEDPALGKELTLALYDAGADIVLSAAGRTGTGCFDAANERGAGAWVVAADTDQSHLGPDAQLCYVKKGVDEAVFQGVEHVVNGDFVGGTLNLGLADGGMDLLGIHASIDPSFADVVAAYKQAIIDGVITVPATDEEFAAFTPTPLDGAASPAATPAS